MNNTDLCRRNLYSRLGIDEYKKRDPFKMQAEIQRMVRQLDAVKRLAESRLIMGGIRYGSEWEHVQLMEYMQVKFDIFNETGNYEMLIDLVNFVVIEGVLQTHPEFNFTPEDR